MKVVAAVAVLTLAGVGSVAQLPAGSSVASPSTAQERAFDAEQLTSLTQPTTVEQWAAPIRGADLADTIQSQRAAEAARVEAERQAAAAREAEAQAARRRAQEATRQKAAAEAAARASQTTTTTIRRVAPAPSGASSDMLSKMDALARCESGGNPTIVSRTGKYYGAFQFSLATWRSIGYTGTPIEYTYEQQRDAAIKLQQRSGWGQWPTCARKLGYL